MQDIVCADDSSIEGWNAVAAFSFRMRNVPKGCECLREAVSIDPTHVPSLLAYAAVQLHLGDLDAAQAFLHGAAELDSTTECLQDNDQDGYGDQNPREGVESGTDCDDDNPDIYPDAQEICDTIDNDCDGDIDDDDDSLDLSTTTVGKVETHLESTAERAHTGVHNINIAIERVP